MPLAPVPSARITYHDVETADCEEFRELQDEHLRETVRRASDEVPFYRPVVLEEGFSDIADAVITLAEAEGPEAHAEYARMRVDGDG